MYNQKNRIQQEIHLSFHIHGVTIDSKWTLWFPSSSIEWNSTPMFTIFQCCGPWQVTLIAPKEKFTMDPRTWSRLVPADRRNLGTVVFQRPKAMKNMSKYPISANIICKSVRYQQILTNSKLFCAFLAGKLLKSKRTATLRCSETATMAVTWFQNILIVAW